MAIDTTPAEKIHADAIKTAIDAKLVGGTKSWHAYDYDEVPSDLPGLYVAITVTRRFADDYRFPRERKMVGYRLTSLAVGRTIDEARVARGAIYAAVIDKRLTIDGNVTTKVRFESENPIEPDDGRYSGLTVSTYAV